MILDGTAPEGLRVSGTLDLSDTPVATLPPGLTANALHLSERTSLQALPPGLKVRRLKISGFWNPAPLLESLHCYELDLSETAIDVLPAGTKVDFRLDLSGCTVLQRLPEGLSAGSLILRDCIGLEALPERIHAFFLDISRCTGITTWPSQGTVGVGRVRAHGCAQLRTLPAWLTNVAQLDLRDCTNLRELPEGLRVTSWVDVAGTRIRSLPASLQGVQLRWRGVIIDERIAFRPELITADEILNEPNAERRRVLLERMGYDTFLAHAQAKVLDEDRDPGGPRRLLRVPMENDEDLVCVSFSCPSTARQYVVRVPPTMRTCHQAVAWMAGFDDPDQYRPLVET